jgi:hypothetical protein
MVKVLIHKRRVLGCGQCVLYRERVYCDTDVTQRYHNYHGEGAPCAANKGSDTGDAGVVVATPPDERRSEAMQLIWLASKD